MQGWFYMHMQRTSLLACHQLPTQRMVAFRFFFGRHLFCPPINLFLICFPLPCMPVHLCDELDKFKLPVVVRHILSHEVICLLWLCPS